MLSNQLAATVTMEGRYQEEMCWRTRWQQAGALLVLALLQAMAIASYFIRDVADKQPATVALCSIVLVLMAALGMTLAAACALALTEKRQAAAAATSAKLAAASRTAAAGRSALSTPAESTLTALDLAAAEATVAAGGAAGTLRAPLRSAAVTLTAVELVEEIDSCSAVVCMPCLPGSRLWLAWQQRALVFVRGGWWGYAWALLLIIDAAVSMANQMLVCRGVLATSGGPCVSYNYALFPMPPAMRAAMSGFIATAVIPDVAASTLAILGVYVAWAAETGTLYDVHAAALPGALASRAYQAYDIVRVAVLATFTCVLTVSVAFTGERIRRQANSLTYRLEEKLVEVEEASRRALTAQAQLAMAREAGAAQMASRMAQTLTLGYVGNQASNVVHQLQYCADCLAAMPHLTTQGREHVGDLTSAVGKLKQIVQDVMTHQRLSEGTVQLTMRNHPLRTRVFDFAAAMQAQHGRSLVTRLAAGVPPVIRCDWFRIEQILTNAVDNAARAAAQRAAGAGGASVRVAPPVPPRIWLDVMLLLAPTPNGAEPADSLRVVAQPGWLRACSAYTEQVLAAAAAAAGAPTGAEVATAWATSPMERTTVAGGAAAASDTGTASQAEVVSPGVDELAVDGSEGARHGSAATVGMEPRPQPATVLVHTSARGSAAPHPASQPAQAHVPHVVDAGMARRSGDGGVVPAMVRPGSLSSSARSHGAPGESGAGGAVPAVATASAIATPKVPGAASPTSEQGSATTSRRASGAPGKPRDSPHLPMFRVGPVPALRGTVLQIGRLSSRASDTAVAAARSSSASSYGAAHPAPAPAPAVTHYGAATTAAAAASGSTDSDHLQQQLRLPRPPSGWQWYWHFEVRNEGCGLGGRNPLSLFMPYETATQLAAHVPGGAAAGARGTGLGLPISHRIAAIMNGRIGLFDDAEWDDPRDIGTVQLRLPGAGTGLPPVSGATSHSASTAASGTPVITRFFLHIPVADSLPQEGATTAASSAAAAASTPHVLAGTPGGGGSEVADNRGATVAPGSLSSVASPMFAIRMPLPPPPQLPLPVPLPETWTYRAAFLPPSPPQSTAVATASGGTGVSRSGAGTDSMYGDGLLTPTASGSAHAHSSQLSSGDTGRDSAAYPAAGTVTGMTASTTSSGPQLVHLGSGDGATTQSVSIAARQPSALSPGDASAAGDPHLAPVPATAVSAHSGDSTAEAGPGPPSMDHAVLDVDVTANSGMFELPLRSMPLPHEMPLGLPAFPPGIGGAGSRPRGGLPGMPHLPGDPAAAAAPATTTSTAATRSAGALASSSGSSSGGGRSGSSISSKLLVAPGSPPPSVDLGRARHTAASPFDVALRMRASRSPSPSSEPSSHTSPERAAPTAASRGASSRSGSHVEELTGEPGLLLAMRDGGAAEHQRDAGDFVMLQDGTAVAAAPMRSSRLPARAQPPLVPGSARVSGESVEGAGAGAALGPSGRVHGGYEADTDRGGGDERRRSRGRSEAAASAHAGAGASDITGVDGGAGRADAVAAEGAGASAPPADGGPRVLVVDDVASNRKVNALMLGRLGFRTGTAEDGSEVVPALAAARDGGDPFALVLMDIVMRTVNGDAALVELRRAGFTMPVVAASGNSTWEDVVRYRATGFTDVLPKPFGEADLAALMTRCGLPPPLPAKRTHYGVARARAAGEAGRSGGGVGR